METIREKTYLVLRAIDQCTEIPFSNDLIVVHHGIDGDFDNEKAIEHLFSLAGFRIEVLSVDEQEELSMTIVSYPDGRMSVYEIRWYEETVSSIHIFDTASEISTIVTREEAIAIPNDLDLGKIIRRRLC